MKGTPKKKWFAVCIAVLMLLTFVTGCAQAPAAPAEAPASGAAEAPAEKPADQSASADTSGKTSIKIGIVAPLTGPMANFTIGLKHTTDRALEVMNKDGGYMIKELNKKLPVEVVYGDCESSSTKASEVATKLVTGDKVDILVGEWTPEITNPVSAVGERNKIPTLLSNSPMGAWLSNGPYEWSFALMFDFDKGTNALFNSWDKIQTNKKVGICLDSTVDGVQVSKLITDKAKERGYTVVDPGRYPSGTKDFSATISDIQKAGCDIVYANSITPELVTLWNQCRQMGFIPKVFVMGKGMLFSTDVVTMGNGENIATDSLWSPDLPYKSNLTGETAAEQGADFEKAINQAPDLSVGYDWAIFDVVHEVMTKAQSLDKEAIRQAFINADTEYSFGHMKFNEQHVSEVPIVCMQWVPDEKWGFTKRLLDADGWPNIKVVDSMLPIPGSK